MTKSRQHLATSRRRWKKRKKSRQNKREKMDVFVLSAMLYIVAWSVAFFIAWLVKNNEPGVLEGCILAPGVAELICTAWIKSSKNKYGSYEDSDIPDEGAAVPLDDMSADEPDDNPEENDA